MKLIELSAPSDPEYSERLAAFERQFDYPLEEDQTFSIDHGPDYTAFFRAMGQAHSWILEADEIVVASLSAVVRVMDLQGHERRVAYIGDLKLHPSHQSRRVLFGLARGLQPLLERTADLAYGIVMDGTRVTPDAYTGRLGIAPFRPVASVHILRFDTLAFDGAHDGIVASACDAETGYALYSDLSAGVGLEASDSRLRSVMTPQWFASSETACGMVEDTRRAKRLYLRDGAELKSAHLSNFRFKVAASGRAVLEAALYHARQNGFSGMFVALSPIQRQLIGTALEGLAYSETKAQLYATDDIAKHIAVNTAEI
jgi:hypothetical protein